MPNGKPNAFRMTYQQQSDFQVFLFLNHAKRCTMEIIELLVKYFGGEVTLVVALGYWLKKELELNKELRREIKELTQYRHEADKETLKLLGDMQNVLATLFENTKQISTATGEKIDSAVDLILANVKGLETLINANGRIGKKGN